MNGLLENTDGERTPHEGGFSLVEVSIAMVVLMIVILGIFVAFTFAVNFNAGNNSRAQALAVLQQEVELIRAAKFTMNRTDPNLDGGVKPTRIVTSADGNRFRVDVVIDDDVTVSGVQTDLNSKMKDITVSVTLDRPTPGWQTSVPSGVLLRRSMSN